MSDLLFLVLAAALAAHLAVPRLKAPSKALLMPLLLLFYCLEADRIDPWVVAALAAATLGDILLLKPDVAVRFLSGLGAFLAGHVFWAVVFLRSTDGLRGVPAWFALAAIPYLGFAVWFLRKLWKEVAGKRAALIVYCLAIVFMSLMALARAFTHGGTAFWLPFAGSLLFLASDTTLAFLVFHKRTAWGDVLCMSAYVAAQSLLVVGMLAG